MPISFWLSLHLQAFIGHTQSLEHVILALIAQREKTDWTHQGHHQGNIGLRPSSELQMNHQESMTYTVTEEERLVSHLVYEAEFFQERH